uniref:AlNc14C254G9700 protein n=1 Tax=Albugo laibachii Nc14 TaxID=890382 RepID=F0WTM3_9STRA|nr:AlNc14C254G9700 [Albugo laibachii Nc14]|eukprot:CCA24715.1 AlNc14C254G9700 [Albugo laibachii Nc14]
MSPQESYCAFERPQFLQYVYDSNWVPTSDFAFTYLHSPFFPIAIRHFEA